MKAPDADYINRVHEMQRRQREVELERNEFWASQNEYLASNKLELSEINRYEARIASVTRESVRDAVRRYLDRGRHVIGVLKPEKEAA